MQDQFVKPSDSPYQQQQSPYVPTNEYNPPQDQGQYNPSSKPYDRS